MKYNLKMLIRMWAAGVKYCTSPQGGEEEEDEDQPLSLAWPDTIRKQITYLIILPIVFPLWLTLPDVRREVTTHTYVAYIFQGLLNSFWSNGSFPMSFIILSGFLANCTDIDDQMITKSSNF